VRFLLEPSLLENVSTEQEREIRLALVELNTECGDTPETLTLHALGEGGIRIVLGEVPAGSAEVDLLPPTLRRHLREYRHIIDQLTRAGFGVRDMETLDYAKKLAHDDAAETVQDAVSPHVNLSLAIARRAFTLIFLLTNELPRSQVIRHAPR
jgi:uncharacterized protein (UPF0262 family)